MSLTENVKEAILYFLKGSLNKNPLAVKKLSAFMFRTSPHGSSRLPHGLFLKSTFKKPNILPDYKFKTARISNILKGFTGLILKVTNVYAGPHGLTGLLPPR